MKDRGIAVIAEGWMSIPGLRIARRFMKNLRDVVKARPNKKGCRLQKRTYVDSGNWRGKSAVFTVTIARGDMLNGQSEGPVLPTKHGK